MTVTPILAMSIRGDTERRMTLGDSLAEIDKQLAELCAKAECGHEQWDENAVARVCLGCRRVLQVKPPPLP